MNHQKKLRRAQRAEKQAELDLIQADLLAGSHQDISIQKEARRRRRQAKRRKSKAVRRQGKAICDRFEEDFSQPHNYERNGESDPEGN